MLTIDAVLPLIPRDVERYAILARSLRRYFGSLGTLYVVIPDASFERCAARIVSLGEGLRVHVVRESEWVPDLSTFSQLRGWYKQQILKLAAASFVATDYFLTLDADVVCTRSCNSEQLLPGGRSPCFVIPRDDHPDWYRGAEAVLGLRAVRRNILHNVTPVLWSRHGVQALLQHLERRADGRCYAGGLLGLQQRALFWLYRRRASPSAPHWPAWLAASPPWAEYATYFTFLEATQTFEKYHFNSDQCLYDVERSLWQSTRSLNGWDPRPLFEGEGPPFFAVIQSNTGIDPSEVMRRLLPWVS
jgi:Family of unknown function (DUF6492)